MIERPEDIKKIRMVLGLTQKDLAKVSGVSQSLIAKIEAQKIDPSFSNIKKIINSIESYKKKKSVLANNIMKSPVLFVNPADSTKKIINLMKKNNYSQLPVKDKGFIVGLVTEKGLISSLASKSVVATDIMEDAPPFVSKNTEIKILISLLKHFPCVLVTDKGNVLGIITKTDILGFSGGFD